MEICRLSLLKIIFLCLNLIETVFLKTFFLGEDVARSAFKKMDKNRNGYLDRDEMNRAFGLLDRLYK